MAQAGGTYFRVGLLILVGLGLGVGFVHFPLQVLEYPKVVVRQGHPNHHPSDGVLPRGALIQDLRQVPPPAKIEVPDGRVNAIGDLEG